MDISLGGSTLRPKRIFALGEIETRAYETYHQPVYLLYSSLMDQLKGSLRNIELLRNGKNITTIDYYSYLLFGKQINDVRLQQDDVVIPQRGRTVTIKGEISRPAIYELKQAEELKELIELQEGLNQQLITKDVKSTESYRLMNGKTVLKEF